MSAARIDAGKFLVARRGRMEELFSKNGRSLGYIDELAAGTTPAEAVQWRLWWSEGFYDCLTPHQPCEKLPSTHSAARHVHELWLRVSRDARARVALCGAELLVPLWEYWMSRPQHQGILRASQGGSLFRWGEWWNHDLPRRAVAHVECVLRRGPTTPAALDDFGTLRAITTLRHASDPADAYVQALNLFAFDLDRHRVGGLVWAVAECLRAALNPGQPVDEGRLAEFAFLQLDRMFDHTEVAEALFARWWNVAVCRLAVADVETMELA